MIFGGRPLAVVFVAGWDRVLVLFYGKFRPIGGKVLERDIEKFAESTGFVYLATKRLHLT